MKRSGSPQPGHSRSRKFVGEEEERRNKGRVRGRGRERKEAEEEEPEMVEESSGEEEEDRNGRTAAQNRDSDSDRRSAATGVSIVSNVSYYPPDDDSESLPDLDDLNFTDIKESTIRLHDMIGACQELDERQDGFREEEDKKLRQQIEQAAYIHQNQFVSDLNVTKSLRKLHRSRSESRLAMTPGMETPSSEIAERGRSRSKKKKIGSPRCPVTRQGDVKASYMLLAYKHTYLCTSVLAKRTQMLGMDDTFLSVDSYLEELGKLASRDVRKGTAQNEEQAIRRHVSSIFKTTPAPVMIIGAFSYSEFLENEKANETVQPKEKKAARPRTRQFNEDTLLQSQIQVNLKGDKEEDGEDVQKGSTSAAVTKAFRKNLVDFCKPTGEGDEHGSAGMLDIVVNKEDTTDSLNNLFHVAFGVRDGSIELSKEGQLFVVKPCKPPSEGEKAKVGRKQCIFSINSATLKRCMEAAEGENAIPSLTRREPEPPKALKTKKK